MNLGVEQFFPLLHLLKLLLGSPDITSIQIGDLPSDIARKINLQVGDAVEVDVRRIVYPFYISSIFNTYIVYQLVSAFKGDLTVFISLHDNTVTVFVIHLDELMFKTVLLALGYAIRVCITTLPLCFLASTCQ